MQAIRGLVLADDLTGALEVGAIFAAQGIRAPVTTERSLTPAGIDPRAQILIVDTETRHLTAAEAGRIVQRLASAAHERGVGFLYLKTDSTLRGNPGSEVCAVLTAFPGSSLAYVPSYPRMGRTVRDGRLYVKGVPVDETAFASDILNPIAESRIPAVLESAGCPVPVIVTTWDQIGRTDAPAVYLVDGEMEEELAAAAEILSLRSAPRLVAGPAGFAPWLARWLRHRSSPPARRPTLVKCLIVNGSLHEISRDQVAHARSLGWRCSNPLQAAASISADGWAILDLPPGIRGDGLEFARHVGEIVLRILQQVKLHGVVVFGGDTAFGILQALGCSVMRPLREALPGIPVSEIKAAALRPQLGERRRSLFLVTKAGGFGPVDVLPALRALLSKQPG